MYVELTIFLTDFFNSSPIAYYTVKTRFDPAEILTITIINLKDLNSSTFQFF